MCEQCWDADKMEDKIRAGDSSCTGLDMKEMTREELIYSLTQEWKKTNKNQYRIYKKAVPNIKEETISWMAQDPENKARKQMLTARII